MYPYNFPRQQNNLLTFIKGINLGRLLDGAQKTLGVINQAIPVVHQVGPLIANAKTMFKIADVINSDDKVSTKTPVTNISTRTITDNKPIFYI